MVISFNHYIENEGENPSESPDGNVLCKAEKTDESVKSDTCIMESFTSAN